MHEPHPEGAITLDADHYLIPVDYNGGSAGWQEYHRKPDGDWCIGFVTRAGGTWAPLFPDGHHWKVEREDPLTLSPSLLCVTCGNHGFVREGKWVGV